MEIGITRCPGSSQSHAGGEAQEDGHTTETRQRSGMQMTVVGRGCKPSTRPREVPDGARQDKRQKQRQEKCREEYGSQAVGSSNRTLPHSNARCVGQKSSATPTPGLIVSEYIPAKFESARNLTGRGCEFNLSVGRSCGKLSRNVTLRRLLLITGWVRQSKKCNHSHTGCVP